MSKKNVDELGDRVKGYESVEARKHLDTTFPVIARIDGRKFSSFTRGFEKPFDALLTESMDAVTAHLIEKTNALIGYTQSDEITLVWYVDKLKNPESQMFFNGRLQKLCSVLAGMTSVAFYAALSSRLQYDQQDIMKRLPHFDCRVWTVPTKEDACDTLKWRVKDAKKNSVSAFTRKYVSAKNMQGLNAQDQLAAAHKAGAPNYYESISTGNKFGRFFQTHIIRKPLNKESWLKIPENKRQNIDLLYDRTEIFRIATDFNTLVNPVEFVFERAYPNHV